MWKLGQRIIINHRLERVKRFEQNGTPYPIRIKEWKIVPTSSKEVMIVGRRVLQNGITQREEGINFFEPKERFEALLVVDSLNRKPFLFDTRQGWYNLNKE